MSSALTFIKLTFMKIMQLQSYLQTLNPETPLAPAVPVYVQHRHLHVVNKLYRQRYGLVASNSKIIS
jgi:GDP-D-mannose dehydratase